MFRIVLSFEKNWQPGKQSGWVTTDFFCSSAVFVARDDKSAKSRKSQCIQVCCKDIFFISSKSSNENVLMARIKRFCKLSPLSGRAVKWRKNHHPETINQKLCWRSGGASNAIESFKVFFYCQSTRSWSWGNLAAFGRTLIIVSQAWKVLQFIQIPSNPLQFPQIRSNSFPRVRDARRAGNTLFMTLVLETDAAAKAAGRVVLAQLRPGTIWEVFSQRVPTDLLVSFVSWMNGFYGLFCKFISWIMFAQVF